MANSASTNDHKDFTKSWVSSSKFLFYVHLFCLVAFILGGCYQLYNSRYQGKPKVDIPPSTLYDPKYSK